MKPCIFVAEIMKIELVLIRIQLFEFSHFRQLLYSRIWSLRNRLLLQFSIGSFQPLHTCCGHREEIKVRCLVLN